jgi:hypothetical protein
LYEIKRLQPFLIKGCESIEISNDWQFLLHGVLKCVLIIYDTIIVHNYVFIVFYENSSKFTMLFFICLIFIGNIKTKVFV